MYSITWNGKTHYVDNITYIKLNPNTGCFVICKEEDAEGVCVKIPKIVSGDNGESFSTCEDTVFAIKGSGLHGTEPLCEIAQAKIAMDYFNAKQTSEIISMLEEVL